MILSMSYLKVAVLGSFLTENIKMYEGHPFNINENALNSRNDVNLSQSTIESTSGLYPYYTE
jgi:hypothetical protein